MEYKLIHGDCYDKLKEMADNSVETVITDPPYGLGEVKDMAGLLQDWIATGWHDEKRVGSKGFLSKEWDNSVPPPAIWKEVLRVLKPGGTALVFAGTRTFDLMALSMKLAGFMHKDTIMFLHGTGFPKASNISKKLDQKKGAERKVVEEITTKSGGMANVNKLNLMQGHRPKDYNSEKGNVYQITEPATDEAKTWNGWFGHALKPAYEPILVMVKENEGSYADNALKWGVAGLNIDGSRVPMSKQDRNDYIDKRESFRNVQTNLSANVSLNVSDVLPPEQIIKNSEQGRFPANIILDEAAAKVLDEQTKDTRAGKPSGTGKIGDAKGGANSIFGNDGAITARYEDEKVSGAARFFYCAKASPADRSCGGLVENKHPTVKNRALMADPARLTKTPFGGVVLDPFMGSGSTGIGCIMENRDFIGIEKDKESFDTSQARLEAVTKRSQNNDVHKNDDFVQENCAFIKNGQEKDVNNKKLNIADFAELDMFT